MFRISFLVLASALAASSTLAAPVLQVGSAVVDVGDIFKIDLSVVGASDLQAFQFDLAYDSTRLRLLSFGDVGTDFDLAASNGFGLLGITGFALDGRLSGVADAMVGVAPGSGLADGVLAEILFQDIAPGPSALIASSVFLNFSDEGIVLANGAVTNPVSQIPEPSTAWLIVAAVCGMRRARPLISARTMR